jgi:molybdenum cofactor cytidylyltransferase
MIAAERVAAILLAAGRSTRFGDDDKLMAPLDGRPLAAHAAAILSGTGFGARIAACAAGSDRLAATLGGAGFTIVHPPAGSGMAQSIVAAVERATALDVDAALICLADMPGVPASHIAALLAAHDPATDRGVASSDGERAMPPVLIGRSRFAAAMRLTGDEGARSLIRDATLVRLTPALLIDIDRPADLNSAGAASRPPSA